MRKAFSAIAVASVVAEARHSRLKSTSPFVGEHKEARTINHGDGRVSAKMHPVAQAINKYADVMYTGEMFPERKSSQAYEYIYGPQEKDHAKSLREVREANERKSSPYGRNRLGQANPAELINTSGMMWTGPMLMGGSVEMDVVYDTGSDWLVVEGHECGSCEGNTYNPDRSEGRPRKVADKESERNYGSASLKGYEYFDRVCIDLNTCVPDFEYFLITDQRGIQEPIDGILGMSRNNAFYINKDAGNTTGPLLMETLAQKEVINADKFSFYFQIAGEESFMDMGEPNEAHWKEGEEVVTTQLLDPDFFWGFYNTGVAVGTIDNAFAYENSDDYGVFVQDSSAYSIIDTGSSALNINGMYFESMVREIFEYADIDDWQYGSGVVSTKCKYTDLLPPVYFQIDGAWGEVLPIDYMYNYQGSDCILLFMPTQMPLSILGMPIHIDYYTMHDPVTGQVGWIPHANSPKSTLVRGPIPTEKFLKIGNLGPTLLEVLVIYALGAAMAGGSIYGWQLYLYPELEKTQTSAMVKVYSSAFFLTIALFTYYALQPAIQNLMAGASSASLTSKAAGESSSLTDPATLAFIALLAFAAYKVKQSYAAKASSKKEIKLDSTAKIEELLNDELAKTNALE